MGRLDRYAGRALHISSLRVANTRNVSHSSHTPQHSHCTMSSTNPNDDTLQIEKEQAVESLTEALKTEKMDEKNYYIREALQLLAFEAK